jgi:hypothetical protein
VGAVVYTSQAECGDDYSILEMDFEGYDSSQGLFHNDIE